MWIYIKIAHSLECIACSLDGNIDIFLISTLNFGNDFRCRRVDGLKYFARLAFVPLVVDKYLQ